MTGNDLADMLSKSGYKIKSKTSTSVVVLVSGNRLNAMKELAVKLHNLGAVMDPNAKG
jgi:glucosamine 6-phosphate synthetase-like amidotransferase/phosphosugar isomerase protein